MKSRRWILKKRLSVSQATSIRSQYFPRSSGSYLTSNTDHLLVARSPTKASDQSAFDQGRLYCLDNAAPLFVTGTHPCAPVAPQASDQSVFNRLKHVMCRDTIVLLCVLIVRAVSPTRIRSVGKITDSTTRWNTAPSLVANGTCVHGHQKGACSKTGCF